MDIIEGRINIESNEYMQKVFKDSMKRAEVSGLHAVNVFSVDPIEGDLTHHNVYFELYGEAEAYAYEYEAFRKDKKRTYLIYIDFELYKGEFHGMG